IGEVAERLNALVSKTSRLERVSGVQISPSPQIETSESERWKKSRADGAGVGKRARRSATNWDGTRISKRADLSRTSGFVPIFCTNDLISWKSFDVDKKLACFKSKIQFRSGSTQLFLPA